MYCPPVNKHSNGKSPSWIGNTSSNGGFSIAMLDYRSVSKRKSFNMTYTIGSSLMPTSFMFSWKMTPVILLMLPEIRRSPVDMVIYPSIYRLSCMSGGAGFLTMDDFMANVSTFVTPEIGAKTTSRSNHGSCKEMGPASPWCLRKKWWERNDVWYKPQHQKNITNRCLGSSLSLLDYHHQFAFFGWETSPRIFHRCQSSCMILSGNSLWYLNLQRWLLWRRVTNLIKTVNTDTLKCQICQIKPAWDGL